MAIEFNCPSCQKLLRTSDDKAGRTAKCPYCQEPIVVPSAASAEPEAEAPFEASADEFDFGEPSFARRPEPEPARAAVGEEEEDHERPPARSAAGMKPCPMCGEQIKAAAVRCRYCGEELEATGRPRRPYLKPHRGGLILTFGILSWAVCFIFGILAWVMGNEDLREIEAGRMDPEGEGLTRAGKIVGMVHIILGCSVLLLYCVIIMLFAAIGALG